MLSSKYRLIVFFFWLLSLFIVYVFGYNQGHTKTFRGFIKQYKVLEIEVAYGRYVGYKNISANISKGKLKEAKCQSDLNASSLYDQLKICVLDEKCRHLIDKEKEYSISPELFEGQINDFKYYPEVNGMRSCRNH